MLMRKTMFTEPRKVLLAEPLQDELYQYRVKNTFIDSFEDEVETPMELGMKSCPAGIWKFASMSPAGLQQPIKVSLDPTSPLATVSVHGDHPRSPDASGMGMMSPAMGLGQVEPAPPPPVPLPLPQVRLGQPSVVSVTWSYSTASPIAFGVPSCEADELPVARAPSYSSGSALHDAGRCEPCAWYWKPTGCRNAEDCKRCHLCSEGALKNRKKAKVAMMRAKSNPEAEEECTSMSLSGSLAPEDAVRHVRTAPAAPASSAADEAEELQQASPAEAETTTLAEQQEVSEGSRLHSIGECEPCAWFWRPAGCSHGAECRRCHLCPEGEVKARKKKKLAMLRKARDEGLALDGAEASTSPSTDESA